MRTALPLLLCLFAGGAATAQPSAFDVFVVAGQSNAEGRGDAAASPPVAPGVAYLFANGQLRPLLGDPVGGANTGSAWPAFANAYHARTGRGVVLVEAAVGGSGASALSNPNHHWGPDDVLFAAAAGAADAALAAARGRGEAGPGGWLWCQGERDARTIDEGGQSVSDYEAAILDVLARYAATPFGQAGAPFYVLQTGRRASGDTPGFQAVRAVQALLPPPAILAYDGAVTLPDRGLMSDEVHWAQGGLNEAGAAVGAVALPVAEEAPAHPPGGLAAAVAPQPLAPGRRATLTVTGARGPVRLRILDALGRTLYDGAAYDGAALPPLGPGRFVLVVSDGYDATALLLTAR